MIGSSPLFISHSSQQSDNVRDVGEAGESIVRLGGHSLAATQVVSRVIHRFKLEMPLQALFQSPTIAEMAQAITESQARKLNETELKHTLAELESLSDAQAQQAVNEERAGFDKDKKRNSDL
ncbi:MAG: phosphopantetheine-binding protein [Candidatus Binatia bacterium]